MVIVIAGFIVSLAFVFLTHIFAVILTLPAWGAKSVCPGILGGII
jgi:hypothetical protein